MDKKEEPILVCSENKPNLDMLSGILAGEGYKVESISEFAGLKTYLEKIQAKTFHALILNIDPARTDTPFLKKMLYESTRYQPVIVIAKSGNLELEREIRAEEIFYYFVEPVDKDEFREVVREALRWYYKDFI